MVSESWPILCLLGGSVHVHNILIYVSSFENAVVLSPTRVMMHLNEVENLDQTVEVAIMG